MLSPRWQTYSKPPPPKTWGSLQKRGWKRLRDKAVDDYKKQCSPDVAGEVHIRTNSRYGTMHKTWASSSQISAWRGEWAQKPTS